MAVFRNGVSMEVTKGQMRRAPISYALHSFQKRPGQRHTQRNNQDSWMMRKYSSVVEATQFMVLCCGGPSKSIRFSKGAMHSGSHLFQDLTFVEQLTCPKTYVSPGLCPSVSRMAWVVLNSFRESCFQWIEGQWWSLSWETVVSKAGPWERVLVKEAFWA